MWQRAVRISALVGLLAAAAAGLGGCSSFRADLAEHETRVAEGGEIAETAVGPIQYAEMGGEGATVLVIHGAGGGFDQGLLVGDMLLHDGYRIIAPSRFGYLETPLPPSGDAGAEAQAEAHAALLDALGIERAAVVGFSAGSYSALALALGRPERVSSLILVVPALGPPVSPYANFAMRNPFVIDTVRGSADLAYWALNRTSRSLVLRLVGVPPAVEAAAPAEQRAFAATMLDQAMPVSRRLDGIENDARTLPGLEFSSLDELSVPTLVICARDDTLVGCGSAEMLARAAAPVVRREVFDTGGHLLLGQHSEVRDVVGVFLRQAAR